MPKLSRWRLLPFAVTLALSALAAGCSKAIIDTMDDTTITTRVKTALLNDPGIGARRIDVDTANGAVTLTGRVHTAAERDQALTLARRVNGVADVKDALQIVPEAPTPPPDPAVRNLESEPAVPTSRP